MPRELEVHVEVAVPVTLHDDNTVTIGVPYVSEEGARGPDAVWDDDEAEWNSVRHYLPEEAADTVESSLWDAFDFVGSLLKNGSKGWTP